MPDSHIAKHTKVQWRINQPINQDVLILNIIKYEWETTDTVTDYDARSNAHSYVFQQDGTWREYHGSDMFEESDGLVIQGLYYTSDHRYVVNEFTTKIADALEAGGWPRPYLGEDMRSGMERVDSYQVSMTDEELRARDRRKSDTPMRPVNQQAADIASFIREQSEQPDES